VGVRLDLIEVWQILQELLAKTRRTAKLWYSSCDCAAVPWNHGRRQIYFTNHTLTGQK
jgi:hypothetical protein